MDPCLSELGCRLLLTGHSQDHSREPWPDSPLLPTGVERQTAEETDFAKFSFSGLDDSYSTIQLTYSPLEFKRLVQLTRYNVLNQAEQVRQALELALHRRQGSEADLDYWGEDKLWIYE